MLKSITKLILPFLALLIGAAFVFSPVLVTPIYAEAPVDPKLQFGKALKEAGLIQQAEEIPGIGEPIGIMINIILTLAGVVTMAIIIYAGGMWLTAAGHEERIKKAQKMLVGAVIGLVIIFSAYFIVNFILELIKQAATEGF